MATVKVNSTVMREKASTLRSNGASIRTLIEEMMAEINRLKSTWEGNTAEAAVQKFTSMQAEFEARYTTIESYATFLENAAVEWERVNGVVENNIDTVSKLQ